MSSPSSLRDKMAQFADLDRPEDDDDGKREESERRQKASWKEDEREYRRRSREFAAALAKKRKAAEMEKDRQQRDDGATSRHDEDDKDDDDDEIEILPGPPPLPAPSDRHSLQPRRTGSSVLSPAAAAAVATIRRTASNPLPLPLSARRGERRESRADGSQWGTSRSPAPAREASSNSSNSNSNRTRAKKQRASDEAPAMVPESQRLFRGLAFYYIPDANLGPRKLRIAKAREYGAQWVHQLDAATHVIVDKQLSWQDIQGELRRGSSGTSSGSSPGNRSANTSGTHTEATTAASSAPTKQPFVVKDDYPLDCIGFRCLLNPEQRRYRLKGYPTTAQDTSSPASSAAASAKASSSPALVRRHSSTLRGKATVKADAKHRRRHGTPPPNPRAAQLPANEP